MLGEGTERSTVKKTGQDVVIMPRRWLLRGSEEPQLTSTMFPAEIRPAKVKRTICAFKEVSLGKRVRRR